MRIDNRANDALRPVSIERHYLRHPEGSVLVVFGDTRVICTASVEESVPRWLREEARGRGWVTAEYAMLPRSAGQRIPRESVNKGRALEISRLIGRSLRNVIDLDGLGERRITIDCDVIQADGGTRTAAITGAYVALADAVSGLVAKGLLEKSPMHMPCAGISVGMVGGEILLDLCYEEDFHADVDMNLVMTADGGIIEVQGCAEGRRFARSDMDVMMDLAQKGIGELITIQNEALAGA